MPISANPFAALNFAFERARDLLSLRDFMKGAEHHDLASSLLMDLANAKSEMSELISENVDLREQLRVEREIGKLVKRDYLWFVQGDDEPLCIGCTEDLRKIIHLTEVNHPLSKKHWRYICPKCHQYYK